MNEVEIPLNVLLELAECRGRMAAMEDYAKARRYNLDPKDLLVIGGIFTPEEVINADM